MSKKQRKKRRRPNNVKRVMAAAAISRHAIAWACCGCNPMTWPLHMAMIHIVYGPDPLDLNQED